MAQNSIFESFDYGAEAPEFPIALLALSKVHGLGIKGITKIVKSYKSRLGSFIFRDLKEIEEELVYLEISGASGISKIIYGERDNLIKAAEKEFIELKNSGISILNPNQIPISMTGFPASPQWLFVEGSISALYSKVRVGVVGTRNPTEEGRKYTRRVAHVLAGYDLVVVSGLAEGIDDEIHKFTMDRGNRNIAFLGHGINKIFPVSTANTRRQIINNGGAVVTEYFPNDNFQKSYFVARNRLQALLSQLVIFVEAKQKSGTAHTLSFAKQYGRKAIGVKSSWGGIDEIISMNGDLVIDFKNTKSVKLLDRELRKLFQFVGDEHRTVDWVERMIRSEISIRDLRRSDIEKLKSRLVIIASEIEEGKL